MACGGGSGGRCGLAGADDLPNLWKPPPDQRFQINALPYLGTGKLDLRKVCEIAATTPNTPP